MTMAEVLEGIRGLGERFDRHAKRLQALERETGMEPDPDPDDDDEAKKKAAAAAALADPDDDDDKDRGRSTRTPPTMTRAQIHRAAKKGQAGPERPLREHRNQPQTRAPAGTSRAMLYDRGKYAQVRPHWRSHKEGYRELEVLEENHITYDRDHLVVPWDFLAEYGRHATKVERKLESWEPKEIQAGYVRQMYDTIGRMATLGPLPRRAQAEPERWASTWTWPVPNCGCMRSARFWGI